MFGGFDYARAVMSRQEMTNFCIFGNFGEMYLFGVFLNGFLFFARIFILSVFFGIRILYLGFFCRYVLCTVRAVYFRARALLPKGSRC